MGNVIRFPADPNSRLGFQRVQATYTPREISRQFGLSEHYIRRWTREGLIPTAPSVTPGDLRYDFKSLVRFRRVRELRGQGLSLKQIESELRGQLNLFPGPPGQLIQLPLNLSAFEQALLLHERGEKQAAELYARAISENDSVADAYCNLAILEFEEGRLPQAFNCLTRSLREDPRHFESHFNIANLYFESGDFRLARLHYEIAAEIEPSCSNVYFNLGLVHAMTGDLETSIVVLEKARELATEEEIPKVDELLSGLKRVMTCEP
jgi:tetratricopeptide (TPR) repeat protein